MKDWCSNNPETLELLGILCPFPDLRQESKLQMQRVSAPPTPCAGMDLDSPAGQGRGQV
eukprot:CAMPEP_0174323148 /NCGR_PEP_ID=MMETSP0810-20121108/11577_1 /TAXON_ID=73025 ORGANISM="Eutreptiella gymnastica-like, Strain CCMP1594" /NCGR_SAMPLE_ID=MMETSP0810 /ASSEMBLY_ACC=CAM_ASM_000659 /LENGTH=58 /DNA_ID=CAMNT_0015435405 /DNA_START=581 /DNA_END=757 /DNA_ORIENTATION=+